MIRIINLRNYVLKENEILVKVDRSSILGNPYPMISENRRNEVCLKYDNHFEHSIQYDEKFKNAINAIIILAKTKDIALGCWCYPKRCHAITIKDYIENTIRI